MCGISGVFHYHDRASVNKRLLQRMNDFLQHRGPDDEGFYYDEAAGLGLGHRRLSIIDLNTGHQPIGNEDGTVWIVFNGEIYNYQDLRHELQAHGHTFKTKTDTEVIIHAYEQWGMDSFQRLNGMYAFALWDGKSQALVLARDPYGVKPLYYWDDGKSLLFASEIKAILCHPKVRREIDPQSLDEFLTFSFIPSPRTIFTGIKKLYPGYALRCGRRLEEPYYFYRKPPILLNGVSEREIMEELRNKIYAAVERQLMSDVPLGVMLSGGVDSSTVSQIATEITGGPLQTFTVGFSNDFDENELVHAREASQRIGSHHHDIAISAEEYADFMPKSMWHLEEPIATASTVAFYKVCELARQHVKVVLTGQGADEPFAGYLRHFGERWGSYYRSLPQALRNYVIAPVVEKLPRNERLKRAVRSLNIPDTLTRFHRVHSIFHSSLRQKLYLKEVEERVVNHGCDVFRQWMADVAHLDHLSQLLYIDSRFSLADNLLMYGDKLSMAVSLEARVPFLDLDLMQFVESIPPQYKIKGFTQKYILKKAVAKWVPPHVLARKKIGFTTPVNDWFRQEMRVYISDKMLSNDSLSSIYFNKKTVLKMIEDHHSGREDYKRALFSLLTLEMWYEHFYKSSQWSSSNDY
ncbi:MAG: asparagine synthase (glutamine-hydrolyzing) [bacterium]